MCFGITLSALVERLRFENDVFRSQDNKEMEFFSSKNTVIEKP